jgi:nicotinamide-nucleotide adenylyltransferase
MVSGVLSNEGVSDCHIVPVQDLHMPHLWAVHVQSQVPPFEVVYANDAVTMQVFKEKGFNVKPVPLSKRSDLSGTEIRRKIAQGMPWRELVPEAVLRIIDEIQGEERIQTLSKLDIIEMGNSG